MNNKLLYRIFALLSFAVTFVVYTMTVQPSVPFWDCGEFSAASIWQQVPHPPGAPLFLMIAKIFHILIPFGDDGWRINMASVTATALTVMFLYIITVKVILNFREEPKSTGDSLAVYIAPFVGSLAFTFSDTFWFNGVESEVYATSSVFVAIVVYLMMRWNEEADNPHNERYLLLIAYFLGLSMGVHLLSLLTIFSIVMLVWMRKYLGKTSKPVKSGIIATIVGLFIFIIFYKGFINWYPALLSGDLPFKNEAKEHLIEDSPAVFVFAIALVVLVAYGLYLGFKKNNSIVKFICMSLLLMFMGYMTYAQVLIRTHANPPMNENEPKNFPKLASYLGREQYGEADNWPRRYQRDEQFIQYYNEKDSRGNYVYGEWYPPARKEVERKDGQYIVVNDWKKINFMGEINYLFNYQIYHMYLRYFFWNFVGRLSDVQDAPAAFFDSKGFEKWNFESGYKQLFPIRFFAIPLIFGLIGLWFHFWRDPKMAAVYLMMFLMMGVLAAIAQNQQNPQPRERDYFYAGSFMVWCMWISLGTYYLIEWLAKKKNPLIVSSIIAVSLLVVPINMAMGGWKMHSRAGNYLPFDYSYNILQSTEENAIIFTNGDNDTFPLWYLQDVAGVRRDVRVVNLSLANTLWYVDQLKNRSPWGSQKLPLSFSDDSIKISDTDKGALSYDFGVAFNVAIPVDREILEKYTNDPAILADGNMRFQYKATPYGQQDGKDFFLYQVRDKLILDILKQTRFKRPVYFSRTVGPDVYNNLERFFRTEGMANRVCPVEQSSGVASSMEPAIMDKCLMHVDNSDNFSKTPKYGFKFRNLGKPGVYYDEVHRRLMRSYRQLYIEYAQHAFYNMKDSAKSIKILDEMNKHISTVLFPFSYDLEYKVALMYDQAGAKKKAKEYAQSAVRKCEQIMNNRELETQFKIYEVMGRFFGPFQIASSLYEMLGDYKSARECMRKLVDESRMYEAQMHQDPSTKQEDMQRLQENLIYNMAAIDRLVIDELTSKGDTSAAIDSANRIIDRYEKSKDPYAVYLKTFMKRSLMDIQKQDYNVNQLIQEAAEEPVNQAQ